MNRLLHAGRALALGFIVSTLAACGTLNAIGGGSSEPSVSPRWAVMAAADKIEPVLDEVTTLLGTGVISDNVADDIAEHGPTVQRLAAAYFDGAESCVVIGAQLTTETSTGRQCERSTLLSIYENLDGEIIGWMIAANAQGDKNTAAVIGAARLVVSLVPKPVAGGPFPGYRDEPDVPLDLFQARRATLKRKFEQLIAAAVAQAGKLVS